MGDQTDKTRQPLPHRSMIFGFSERLHNLQRHIQRISASTANWITGQWSDSLGSRKWWVDHGVDVATLMATVVLAFLIHALDERDRARDSILQTDLQNQQQTALKRLDDDQRLAVRQTATENDIHQAFVFYTELMTAGENGRKRAVALTIKQYAMQGRLYQPAVNMFIDDLRSECDQLIFDTLRIALDTANNVSRKDATSDENGDLARDDANARNTAAVTLVDAMSERSRVCGVPSVAPQPSITKSVDFPIGYFDVGCGESRQQLRAVPLSDDLKKNYKISSATATFTDTSNLDASYANTQINGDTVTVSLYLRGLPKSGPFQLNCAGGGHGTVVVHMELSRR